jgi:sulfite reductase (NADPH) flavoprotein alpha-component
MLPALQTLPHPAWPEDRVALLARLTDGLGDDGLWWLSGYAAGLAQRSSTTSQIAVVPVAEQHAVSRLSIVYGSQTGNAKRIAERLAQQVEASGLSVRLLRADAYPLRELKDERCLAIVISTQGDGDPSDDARGFVEFVSGKRAPELKRLQYGVLGLGDSSYPQFCAIGRRLDARLAELGGTRLHARGDADLDIETIADPWLTQTLDAANAALKSQVYSATITPLRPLPAAPAWSREQPFTAEVLGNQRMTSRESVKDIRHIELALQGTGLDYEPGDALGIWPNNPPALVDSVLDALHFNGDAAVTHAGRTLPLRTWLGEHRELTRFARPFIAGLAARSHDVALDRLLAPDNAAEFANLIASQQVIDLLQRFPAQWSEHELVEVLRPLAPRLYSIASSRKSVGDEAHLTVAHVAYPTESGWRWGAASHHLASAVEGTTQRVYIERNERFRLPADPSRDVIMIGPGTGVAPFRGFVQERTAIGAGGRNWLLFGNPHLRSDFLYQLEWQQALRDGRLQRLDVAFSRDGADKTYVQHRLHEHGRDLLAWLESGASLYVCGAIAMGKDVHKTLLQIVAEQRGGDAEAATDYLDNLQRQGRYARDTY